MLIWLAKPGEIDRKPELRELASFSTWQSYFMAATDVFPGHKAMTEKIAPSGSITLRTRTEIRMKMPGMPVADVEAAAPILETNQDVSEISTAPIDESFFRIPEGYKAAKFEDLYRSAFEPAPSSAPPASPVKAYVPALMPLQQTEPKYTGTVRGMVDLLVTLDAQGSVSNAEVLAGPEPLRQAAQDAVKQWKYRPVMRNGAAVPAYTDAMVTFLSQGGDPQAPDMAGTGVTEHVQELQTQYSRPALLVVADLEQDSAGGDEMRRYYALGPMAKAAVQAGQLKKAATYATELLNGSHDRKDWNYGNAIHDGNMVLGIVSLRRGDTGKGAGMLLLEAGRTPGFLQLALGPDMSGGRTAAKG